jgi:hypothetical protein
MQVLDGPPGIAIRRPSTFLLIPVGQHRRGFAFGRVPRFGRLPENRHHDLPIRLRGSAAHAAIAFFAA